MPGKEDITTIHRYLSGEMNSAERTEFEARLSADSNLMSLKHEIEQVWEVTLNYVPPTFAGQPAFVKLNQRVHRHTTVRRRMWITVAAAVVLLCILGTWALVTFSGTGPMQEIYATETLTKSLGDGSELVVRSGATVRVPESFGGGKREVEIIQGEVFFDIASESERSFVVSHVWAEVEVVGTQFVISVDTSTGDYVLQVSEGHVRFTPHLSDEITDVHAGEGLRFNEFTRVLQKVHDQNPNVGSWRTGVLTFIDRPVGKVIEDLGSHYMVQIQLKDTAVSTCRFTALQPYENVQLDEIISALCTTFGMKLSYDPDAGTNQYVLEGGKCR